MNRSALALLAGLGICVAAGTAGATVFQIDEFTVTENGQTYWMDSFGDGAPPADGDGTVDQNLYKRVYLTQPQPALPGPEAGGKLALDTAQGFLNIGTVTPVPNLVQRARVNAFTSPTAPQDGKLTSADAIVVSALYDLAEPQQNSEYYGIRLTDWAMDGAGEGLRLAVRKNLSGIWEVDFSQAQIGVQWNTIQSWTLSDILGIGDYEQIALSLFNDPLIDGDAFTAQFTLLDLDGPASDLTFTSVGQGLMFQVSDWLRPDFVVGVRVPVPAVLPLLTIGLIGMRLRYRRPAA